MVPQRIAILGGGLTGLTAAFHLSRRFPTAQITLLEQEKRPGGWVRSERVSMPGGGTVLLEAGPRTLRPNSRAVLELVNVLALQNSLLTIPKSSSVAQRRYLRIPGSKGLTPIPPFTSPLFLTLVSAMMREPFRFRNRDPRSADESFDSFLSRRFGESFARNFGSALVHGIYAADSRKLSVRAAFPALWEAEEQGRGSVLKGIFARRRASEEQDDYEVGTVAQKMEGVSIFTFKDGLETLITSLGQDLDSKTNVHILTGAGVDSLSLNPATQSFELSARGVGILRPTHVVSALPLPRLHALLREPNTLPHLTANPSSSVTVVNLVFPSTPRQPLHPPGFGYLVPRPLPDYSPQHSGILGTVFDSAATSAQDTPRPADNIKMTVMMGGPYPITPEHTTLPTILRHLASDLSSYPRALPDPLVFRVHHHKDCIPTFTVGHVERMKELSDVLSGEPWCGRLEVIGAGVGGVSVGDCVKAGKEAGRHWALG